MSFSGKIANFTFSITFSTLPKLNLINMRNQFFLFLILIFLVTGLSCKTAEKQSVEQGKNASTNTVNATINNLFIESESKTGFDETIESLKAAVEMKTWKITAIHDLQETLKKNGYNVQPVKVFAICHPRHSSQILSLDDERIVSPLMPCRVSVYMKSNGKTYISRMNPAVMSVMFTGKIAQVMAESAGDVEEMLQTIIK